MAVYSPTAEPAQRAAQLLQSLLTPEQLVEYRTSRRITVRGSEGGLYRIVCDSITENVFRLEKYDGVYHSVENLCAGPYIWMGAPGQHIPFGDVWVGQLLALRYNERGFRQVASIWAGSFDHRPHVH